MVAPLLPAPVEIVAETVRTLIPILGGLREQPHDNRRQLFGNGVRHHGRRTWCPRDVRVHELERILALERRTTDEHCVQRCANRVEIGAMIDRAADAAGLLWRDIRRRRRGEH